MIHRQKPKLVSWWNMYSGSFQHCYDNFADSYRCGENIHWYLKRRHIQISISMLDFVYAIAIPYHTIHAMPCHITCMPYDILWSALYCANFNRKLKPIHPIRRVERISKINQLITRDNAKNQRIWFFKFFYSSLLTFFKLLFDFALIFALSGWLTGWFLLTAQNSWLVELVWAFC